MSVVSPSPPRGSFQELGRTERLQNFMVNRVQGRAGGGEMEIKIPLGTDTNEGKGTLR